MFVGQRLVRVYVTMTGAGRHRNIVCVLMMFVMHMFMFMRHGLVRMFVFMAFGQMQPDAQRHQAACNEQRQRHRLAIITASKAPKKGAMEK